MHLGGMIGRRPEWYRPDVGLRFWAGNLEGRRWGVAGRHRLAPFGGEIRWPGFRRQLSEV